MSKREISRPRLILNVIACAVIAPLCLLVCVSLFGSVGSLSHPPAIDPDRNKAIGIYLFGGALFGALGTFAGISLVRTIRALRKPEA